jgi:uncharacterized FlaG/YvyC family protein
MFTEQNNNRVAGSLAGRDINDPVTNNYITHQYPNERKTQIGFLYERLKQEVSQKEDLQEFVEELQHYMGRAAAHIDRSLSEKLAGTGRDDLISIAEELKEIAAKKIMRFQSSPASQDIFAYVLGQLHTKYLMHVRPLIAAQNDRTVVDAAMERYVINPIAESMEPSALGLTPKLILAFLFYLAGNCHVQWD